MISAAECCESRFKTPLPQRVTCLLILKVHLMCLTFMEALEGGRKNSPCLGPVDKDHFTVKYLYHRELPPQPQPRPILFLPGILSIGWLNLPPHATQRQFTMISDVFFSLFFKFYCSSTVFCLFPPPQPPALPTSFPFPPPHPHYCPCVLYNCS